MQVLKRIFAVAALCAVLAPIGAPAQEWPKQKPVQFIVAFGPGSTTDIVGREEIPKWAKAVKDSGAEAD